MAGATGVRGARVTDEDESPRDEDSSAELPSEAGATNPPPFGFSRADGLMPPLLVRGPAGAAAFVGFAGNDEMCIRDRSVATLSVHLAS